MDDTERMRIFNSKTELLSDSNGIGDRQTMTGRAPQQIAERSARDVLADDVEAALLRLAYVIDADDMRMVAETAHRACFAQNSRPARVVQPFDPKQGNRHIAIQPLVVGKVDDLAATHAQHPTHAIAPAGNRFHLRLTRGRRSRARAIRSGTQGRIGARGKRPTASSTELLIGAVAGAAHGAGNFERRPALATETTSLGVTAAARTTQHPSIVTRPGAKDT